jgi:WD40 repeat protein
VAVLKGWRRDLNALAFSPDGQLLVTAGTDNLVRFWRVPSGELAGVLEGHTTGVSGLAFAPDGKTLVSAANYDSIKFWHVATRQEMLSFRESSDFPVIIFSADSTTKAVGTGGAAKRTATLKFWRAPSWQEIAAEERRESPAGRR